MSLIKLSDEDRRRIYRALQAQTNLIETGDVAMSAESARQAGCAEQLKPLTAEQRSGIAHLRTLADRVLTEQY